MPFDILSLFNLLTPKEGSVKRVARDIAYGPDARHRYDIYAPKALSDALPLLVFFYGGGWYSGAKADYAWVGHALAARGYVVAIPDYRLVPQVLYPAFLDDNAAAIAHLVAHGGAFGADVARLGVCGHSAGAYAAAMMALDPGYYGPVNGRSAIRACVGISGPYDFYPFDVEASQNAFGQWPHPAQTQPITYAATSDTAFLLQQSRADTVVGAHNAVNLHARLVEAGCRVKLNLYDGLSHEETAAALSIPFRGKAPILHDLSGFLAGAL